jgi:NADH:ubiquinone oxidoreductase subunit F (NADH-binding)
MNQAASASQPRAVRFDRAADREPYQAWHQVVEASSPNALVETILASGLRGRGGAGFPTGRKLQLAADAMGEPKYVVVNGAEDEPGSGKDRFVLERNPALVVEGALLAAWAVGARQVIFYISQRLDAAQRSLEAELTSASDLGLVELCPSLERDQTAGPRIAATVLSAPTAYVAGEDTAALEVIEGKEGLPRTRPPYPVTEGLWGRPTLVANVETVATLPAIVLRGADWYRNLGTVDTPGTMLFTLGEEMAHPGVYELELGTPLRLLLEGCGGGLASGVPIRAVLPGGPSSGFLPSDLLDTPLDHQSMRDAGSALGCGIVRVYGEDECMVEALEAIVGFFAAECCGQCPPCRMETGMLVQIVGQVRSGRATEALLDKLPEVVDFANGQGGICSFIGMPILPVKTALERFRDDFEHHLRTGTCSSKV